MKIVDLTHTFTSDMPVYPGDPESTLERAAYIEKDSYNDHRFNSLMHVGTHMDAPLHMIESGAYVSEIDPKNFIGNGVLIDVRGRQQIDASVLKGIKLNKGDVVLLYTGFGKKFRKPSYYKGYPEVLEDFARKMANLKIKMIGMDFLGPDYDKPWVTHKIMLGSGILILENLTNLDKLLKVKKFQVIALPAKLQADAAPLRAIAVIG